MNLNEILAEFEADKSWRDNDLVFFENQLANEQDEEKQRVISKALILLLYANFEGHVKLIFQTYVKTINQENLYCKDVIYQLQACSLDNEFREYKSPTYKPKHRIFKKEHPKGFVELGRRIEFLENLEEIMTTPVNIDQDKIIDTESNLSKTVVHKIIYRLGFDENIIDDKAIACVEKLLNFRNNIAHGSKKSGWTYDEYQKIKKEVNQLVQKIKQQVIEHLSNEKYKKPHEQ